MSIIDLDRLRVRQTYFVPIKASELKDAILKELEICDKPVYNVRAWIVTEEHARSFTFEYMYKYAFIKEGPGKLTEELAKKRYEEYDNGYPETFFNTVRGRVGRVVDMLHVFIIRTEENGCICDVECSPTLYRKITQLHEKREDIEIEDAHVNCRRFLKHIFESGLSSTLLKEEKKEGLKPFIMLLVNDVRTRQITEKITTMVDGATNEILIFAWMGTILLEKLRELKEKGVKIRVITGNPKGLRQDVMRKEKEKAFEELIQIIGKDHISINPEFHGRAIIVDNKALIGSMDLDSYSLTGTRIEFAIYTEDPETVRNLRNYFNRIFSPWKEEATT